LRRGAFDSVRDLQRTITELLKIRGANPLPFVDRSEQNVSWVKSSACANDSDGSSQAAKNPGAKREPE
jgi:hypothetical protein